MFNDKNIIKYLLRSWNYGIIAFQKGSNQMWEDLDISRYDYLVNLFKRAYKPNCIIKQWTKSSDIERIINYINNNQVKIDIDKYNISIARYVSGYVNKKMEASQIENIFNKKYYFLQDKYIKDCKHEYKIAKIENRQATIKEQPFIFKSQMFGYRYAIDNKDELIKNPTIPKPLPNNPFNRMIIPKYFIDKIVEYLKKNKNPKWYDIIYNKNVIISDRKIERIEKLKSKYPIDYEVKRYFNGTIDIIDTGKANITIAEAERLESLKNEYNKKLKNSMFGEKLFKSELSITPIQKKAIELLNKNNNDIYQIVLRYIYNNL